MPVGWLRILRVILDIGFCTGRVEFFLLALFYHIKALKAAQRVTNLRKCHH